jgi:hypothetical protein
MGTRHEVTKEASEMGKQATLSRDAKRLQDREVKLKKSFSDLGTSKTAIAASLKVKRIKGNKGCTETCPFAIFAKKLFPKADYVEVDGDSCTVQFGNDIIFHEFNKAQRDFVAGFDKGKYPELDLDPEYGMRVGIIL